MLQDCTLRTPIGVSEQQGGVNYYKEGLLGVDQVNAISSSNLWHKLLGHASSEVLSLPPSSLRIVFKKDKNKVCETYYRTKQTPSQFYVSHIISQVRFRYNPL